MAKDDTEILKTIIAKSTKPEYVKIAQTELGALQERKMSLAAAIQPALDVPKIVAQPTSKAFVEGNNDVSKDIRSIKKDISSLLGETRKSSTLLEGILKTNQKYFESNSELMDRLLRANDLSREQLEALRKQAEQQASQVEGTLGDTNAPPSPQPQAGGGGLLGGIISGIGGGLLGYLGNKMFNRNKPAVDVDLDENGKPKPTADDDKNKSKDGKKDSKDKKNKKRRKGKGRLGALLSFLGWTAAATGALQATDFLTDEDAEWGDLIPDVIEDNLDIAPDLAMAGMQLPTIAGALRGKPTPVTPPVDVPEPRPPAGPEPRPPSPEPPVRPNAKAPSNPSSQAQDILNERLRGRATKATQKEIIEAATEKVGKSTLKSVIKKIPIAGLLAGLGFGAYRYLWEGDPVGAGLEVGAGAAAIVPGIGTVGSVGIDIATMVRDIYAAVYGTYPEEDALASERFDDLNATVMKYFSDMYSGSSPEPQSSIEMPQGAADDFAAAIAATNGVQTSTDVSVNPNKSRAEYLASAQSKPVPTQRMTPDKLNTIKNAAGSGQSNIVINKQGDTINNVNNATGGGAGGVAGSPSKIPSPFDQLLYGDVFNWGY